MGSIRTVAYIAHLIRIVLQIVSFIRHIPIIYKLEISFTNYARITLFKMPVSFSNEISPVFFSLRLTTDESRFRLSSSQTPRKLFCSQKIAHAFAITKPTFFAVTDRQFEPFDRKVFRACVILLRDTKNSRKDFRARRYRFLSHTVLP